MAFPEATQAKVYEFLSTKMVKKIEEYTLSDEDAAKPFQYALFTKPGYLAKGFIHGCETALGNWHESIARMIASDTCVVAKKLQGSTKLQGRITREAQHATDNILSDLESVRREPNHDAEWRDIERASKPSKHYEVRSQTIDLFLQRENGEEVYFEIKGPKPNKNEMRAAKRDLLEILAMRACEGIRVKVFLGMYYNPYFPKEYERWTCLKFFEKGGDFLIGKDFWDTIGGAGTYEKLIAIYERVGEELRPLLQKKFHDLDQRLIAT